MASIYLGGAVDLADGHDAKEMLAQAMAESGHVVYQPWRVFRTEDLDQNGSHIRRINFAAIKACDGVLAVLHADQFTFGTVVDVEYARQMCVPVVIWLIGTKGKVPAYLSGYTTYLTEGFDVHSMGMALGLLEKLMSEPPMLRALRRLPEAIRSAQRVQAAIEHSACQDEAPVASETYLEPVGQASETVLTVQCTVEEGHNPPTKAYDGDAGFDLHTKGDHFVMQHSWADIAVGTKLAIPDGYWGFILGRSSTFYKRGLSVHPAVIDCSYRGEMRVAVHNPSNERVKIADGERIAQLILIPLPKATVELVGELPEGERGERGFGSSGA